MHTHATLPHFFFCLSADHRFGGYLTSDVSDCCTFLPLCALLKGEIKGPELFLCFSAWSLEAFLAFDPSSLHVSIKPTLQTRTAGTPQESILLF